MGRLALVALLFLTIALGPQGSAGEDLRLRVWLCADDGCAKVDSSRPAAALDGLATILAGFDPQADRHLRARLDVRDLELREQLDVHLDGHAPSEPEGQVPCGDSSGCPNLVVDATAMAADAFVFTESFGADSCAVVEGMTQAGTRRLLRFTFSSPNVGEGDLVVGPPAAHPEWFEHAACHNHHHFRQYADYRLWTPDGYAAWQAVRAMHLGERPDDVLSAHPFLASSFLAGHKQGFCVIDVSLVYPSPGSAPQLHPRAYSDCNAFQGISVMWADRYGRTLDGQWIDVTDLPPGPYVLEAEVNPERLFREARYDDNAAAILTHRLL